MLVGFFTPFHNTCGESSTKTHGMLAFFCAAAKKGTLKRMLDPRLGEFEFGMVSPSLE